MANDIPEIRSNAVNSLNNSNNKQKEKTDYQKMPSSTSSTARKKKDKPWPLNLILPEDVPDIWTYLKLKKDDIIQYVVWPKIQDILLDSFSTILGVNITKRNSSPGTLQHVSYDQKYRNIGSNISRSSGEPMRAMSPRYSMYENIGFDTSDEADLMMHLVDDLFNDQGYITVLQFYNIAQRPTSPEQNNYGWLSISSMKRIYSGGRYYVDMAWPIPLN